MKISNHTSASFARKVLPVHQFLKGMYKPFMKTRRNENVKVSSRGLVVKAEDS
jgi:hypothetical protein